MHLYSGSTADFVSDATRNRMADKLASAFFDHFRYRPSQSEVHSWQNSLRAMSQALSDLIAICVDDAQPLDACPILAALEASLKQDHRVSAKVEG